MRFFVSDFFHLAWFRSRFSHIVACISTSLLLRPNNVLFNEYTTFYLSMHHLMDTLGLLWITLLWTFVYRFLCGFVFRSLKMRQKGAVVETKWGGGIFLNMWEADPWGNTDHFMLHSTAQLVKNLPANAGDARDAGSIPVLGRSPGGEHGNPLQYSWLENPMDGGAWWATVHGVRHDWACTHTDGI